MQASPQSVGMSSAVEIALITASVTVVGWFVTRVLEFVSSRRTTRSETRQRYVQKQIEEFYGPLFSLVWQIFNSNHLQFRILSGGQLDQDQRGRIIEYFASTHFKPLHEEIRQILKAKLYLVDGSEMPVSFYEYLQHSSQELIQHDLWIAQKIDTSYIPGRPFPQAFYDEIEQTLKRLMSEYQSRVDDLRLQQQNRPRSAPPSNSTSGRTFSAAEASEIATGDRVPT
jgi:hypothetical protein